MVDISNLDFLVNKVKTGQYRGSCIQYPSITVFAETADKCLEEIKEAISITLKEA